MNINQLDGKVAIVTGAGRGIGKSIAQTLANNGATVIFNFSKSAEAAQKAASEITAGKAIPMGFDVSDFDAVKEAVEKISKDYGTPAIVVNNAGITRDNLLLRASEEDFDATINTNLKGVFNVTKAVTKPMMKARAGSIINISSVIGEMGNPGQSIYAASKAGIIGFTKSVAKELSSRHIRANCVTPGYIATEMTDALTDEQKKAVMDQVPLGSIGTPEDVAGCVLFLATDASRYITGQVIGVNGGLYM